MMRDYDSLKEEACNANKALSAHGIVFFTWGNVSIYDRTQEVIAIKPSGVNYDVLTKNDIVVVSLDRTIIEGTLNPSSDLDTHLELYRNFPDANVVVHTHSSWACGWAQSGNDLPCLGTTHADCFYGMVPCTRALTEQEVRGEYERNTGKVIVETFLQRAIDPTATPGVLVRNHGPFVWGTTAKKAVENAVTLEIISKVNAVTFMVHPSAAPVPQHLLDKHYYRKHGTHATYGQKK